MTIKELKDLLKSFDDDLPVVLYYDLNDWPGDCWSNIKGIKLDKPANVTETNSAMIGADKVSLLLCAD